ncbi:MULTISPECIES: cytochrome P450 [unclassified Streptomyces]|uniref:cytochrome P450 n=1 Tax=unclassified Streptomyces TaxID=2593676 RepID=UPI0007571E9E|nr:MULTISPECIES: cytochrome P450 [unclassified Streptomyces]AQT71351.1 cytochrome P450 [Streptomyces sp. fd1-xmd]
MTSGIDDLPTALSAPVTGSTRRPPGPRLPAVVQTLLFAQYRHRLFPYLKRRHGDVFTLRLTAPTRHLVILTRQEDIRTVFGGPVEVLHAGEGNAIMGPALGEHSVLLTDEAEHRRSRRLLMPAFTGAALVGYREMVGELTRAEVESWPEGTVFGSHERMQALTLEVILQVVFGVTDEARLRRMRPLVRGIADIGPVTLLGLPYPLLARFGPWRRHIGLQRRLDELLYAEIGRRRRAADLHSRTDVLSRLLQAAQTEEAGGGFSDVELRDQLITLLLAGHETTATGLAWALHELVRRPEQLRRAQRAADEGDDAYLTAVAKEALRLKPVVYEVARQLTQPLTVGGYRLPAGATVMPAIGMVQSDPAYHDQPDRFRPERFLDGQPPANTWIPFGGGARRCIGAGFALLEATVALREVLRRYEIRPDRPAPERQKAHHVTLIPSRGARLVVSRRR